jgi:nitroreductase
MSTTVNPRSAEAPIDPHFLDRWSSRSFAPDEVTPEQIQSLFEAARWAPSASNLQPWLFVYAHEPESLERVRPIVRDGNRRWADQAPLLVFVFARRHDAKGNANHLAAYDTGAAWMSLALQASKLGLVAHAMGGIHHDRAYAILGVPSDEYEALVGIAIGKRGGADQLPEDLRARESPSPRRAIREFAFPGAFRRD